MRFSGALLDKCKGRRMLNLAGTMSMYLSRASIVATQTHSDYGSEFKWKKNSLSCEIPKLAGVMKLLYAFLECKFHN